jgi:uncharacterized protein
MTRKRTARSYLRAAMIGSAILLPALSLIPLGSLWLWQNGYLLYWIGGALILSSASYAVQTWLVGTAKSRPIDVVKTELSAFHDPSWTPREIAAWNEVEALAAKVDPTEITDRESMVALALRAIETVARSMHPTDDDPLWRFTVPEALALIERVSREMRPFVVDNIPLGDQLTVTQVMKIYRWRSAIDVAEKAYDLWRIVRLLNPIAAVTNEARERLTKKLYSGVRDELAKRLTQGFVKEVGRAAIDLYGGRLRVSSQSLAEHLSEATKRDREAPEIAEPLRFLVAGQIGAGKSSLINALLREISATVDSLPATGGFAAFALKHETLPPILLIDSPGIQDDPAEIGRLATEAGECDLVIWVAAANRADRRLDRVALDAVRAYFVSRPDRRHPPFLAVMTHIDRLRPYAEWAPPYDLNHPTTEKARSIASALKQVSVDLAVGLDSVVPVSVADRQADANINAVWAKIADVLPDARHAQLVRRLRGATGRSWGKFWSQAVNAGRTATRALSKSKTNPP